MPAGPVSPSFPPTAENEGGPASPDSHPPSERKAAFPEPPPPHHRDGKRSSGDERRSTANGPATLQRTPQDAEPEPRRTWSRSPAGRGAGAPQHARPAGCSGWRCAWMESLPRLTQNEPKGGCHAQNQNCTTRTRSHPTLPTSRRDRRSRLLTRVRSGHQGNPSTSD